MTERLLGHLARVRGVSFSTSTSHPAGAGLVFGIPETQLPRQWTRVLDAIETQHVADLPRLGAQFTNGHYVEQRQAAECVLGRLSSYTVLVHTLDRLLHASRTQLRTFAKEFTGRPAPIAPAALPDAAKTRVPEVIRLWRNKVFAHCAWAEPDTRGVENDSARTTALRASETFGWHGGDVRFGGVGYLSGGIAPDPELPPLSMKIATASADDLILRWADELEWHVNFLLGLPWDDVVQRVPHLQTRIWWDADGKQWNQDPGEKPVLLWDPATPSVSGGSKGRGAGAGSG